MGWQEKGGIDERREGLSDPMTTANDDNDNNDQMWARKADEIKVWAVGIGPYYWRW